MTKFALAALLTMGSMAALDTSVASAHGRRWQSEERPRREHSRKSKAFCVPEIDVEGAPLAGAIALLALGIVWDRRRTTSDVSL